MHKLILGEPAGRERQGFDRRLGFFGRGKNRPFSRRGGIVANDNFRIIYAMRVFVLALDGVFGTGSARASRRSALTVK